MIRVWLLGLNANASSFSSFLKLDLYMIKVFPSSQGDYGSILVCVYNEEAICLVRTGGDAVWSHAKRDP